MTSRPSLRVWLAAGAAAVLLGAGLPAGASPPADGAPPETRSAAPAARDERTHSLTLITGDVVTVTTLSDGTQVASVEPAPGASGTVLTQVVQDQLHVIPAEAMPFIASGVLDRQLFNASLLIDYGYADEPGAAAPVIVEFDRPSRFGTAMAGARTTATLESITAQAMETDQDSAQAFWHTLTGGQPDRTTFTGGVTAVHLDGLVGTTLTESIPLVGADQAWAQDLTGEGVTVAVLDTGADLAHPDLVDVVTDSVSFVPGETVADVDGHGTHVASTVAGSGAASAAEGGPQLIGVAPDADLIIGKVLDDSGFGQISWVIDGMEWAAQHADVVNMSLGTFEPSDGTDPMSVALNEISEQTGALFVVAGGNYGRISGIGSPGAAEAALTVSATDKNSYWAGFPDQGPRLGDALVKPDLSAPGTQIVAARSQASSGEGWYASLTGTSMSTPHVAGAAAILAQANPDWTGAQLKEALMSSATPVESTWDGPFQIGTGLVDIPAALHTPVVATGSVSFGFFGFPHEDHEPVVREISYTNRTGEDLTVSLAVQPPEFTPLPDGLVELSADELTVSAGGTATVEVTLDPQHAEVPSMHAGWIVASADGTEVARTSWGSYTEEERYDVTLTATDLDGSPASAFVTFKEADDFWTNAVQVDGETTLRLPAGDYAFMTFMDVNPAVGETGVALLGDPQVTLDQDVTIDLDARQAAEITVTAPQDGLTHTQRRMEYDIVGAVGLSGGLHIGPAVDRLYAAPLAGPDQDSFEYRTRWRLRTPLVQLTDGDAVLDVLGFGGSAIPEGEALLPAVYGGSGTEAELNGLDLAGAALVITRDPSLDLAEIAHRVDGAGAGLLLVVNHQPGPFVAGVWSNEGEQTSIPVVGMRGVDGAGFVPRVQAGSVALGLAGGVSTPVLYDLVDAHAGTIGTDLAFAPGPQELARIDSEYHGDRDRDGGEFRYDFGRHSRFGTGSLEVLDVPHERVEWVSTQEYTQWYQDLLLIEDNWNERGTRTAYQAGSEQTQSWFSAVVQPRLGEGYWLPNRQGNFLQVNLPSWAGDDPTHTGGMGLSQGTEHQEIRWYDGDTLIGASSGWQSSSVSLSTPDPMLLRVTNEVSRDADRWPTTPASFTEWTFWTEQPEDWFAELPFVQVDFDVETDLAGVVRPTGADVIGFSAWQLPGTALAGEIVDGSLAVSYDDGDSWTELELTGEVGDWTAAVSYPAEAEHVSLRGTATDSMGNAVSMELTRAYLLGEPDLHDVAVDRIAGDHRYATAALLSEAFETAEVVYVATGELFPDALAAAAVAGAQDVPVLLTRGDLVPASTRAALERLQPSRIVVLGGEETIQPGVFEVLDDLAADGATRLAGDHRYHTAAMVAEHFEPGVPVVYLATGTAFPDALAGGARAGAQDGPVLLSRPDRVPASTLAALERLQPERIVLLGDEQALDAGVAEVIAGFAPVVERVFGDDRYGTAAALSAELPTGLPVVYLATGQNFPDALAGSAVAASQRVPVLLSRPDLVPAATLAELARLRPQRVVLLGGPDTLGVEVEQALEELFDIP